MLIVIGLMICGIVVGYCLRKRNLRFVSSFITIAIWALLFLLGIQVGSDRNIMDNLGLIGWEALILTLGAVLGSVVCAWLIYRFIFSGHSQK